MGRGQVSINVLANGGTNEPRNKRRTASQSRELRQRRVAKAAISVRASPVRRARRYGGTCRGWFCLFRRAKHYVASYSAPVLGLKRKTPRETPDGGRKACRFRVGGPVTAPLGDRRHLATRGRRGQCKTYRGEPVFRLRSRTQARTPLEPDPGHAGARDGI